MRHAVLTAFFGQLRDRFCDYQHPLSIEDKLLRASEVPGVQGVEVMFPDEVRDARQIAGTLAGLNLQVAAVNVNLKSDPAFAHGALSSPDAGVRRLASEFMAEAKRLAGELGVSRVTCAPLADGYDATFQLDYRRAWRRVVESVASAASDRPEITLHLEHKPADPRRSAGLLDSPEKVVLLCRDAGVPSLGITFNVGHTIAGGRLPAAAFASVLLARIPYYVHFCDATAAWDWDLRVGTHHLWAWAEFLCYLKQDGYDGWLTADTFPVRQDARGMFAANVSLTDKVTHWLACVDADAVLGTLEQRRAVDTLAGLEAYFWGPA